jgi:amiloride-sensitive sodium channel
MAVFVGGAFFNYHLISTAWNKWHETPVIVTLSETTTPVWKVPFPAVTVCPQTKYRASTLNFSRALETNNTSYLNTKQ